MQLLILLGHPDFSCFSFNNCKFYQFPVSVLNFLRKGMVKHLLIHDNNIMATLMWMCLKIKKKKKTSNFMKFTTSVEPFLN